MRRLATRETASGLLFAGIGVVGIILSLEEQIGTTARMESGYVPLLLSGGLVVMGLVIIATGLHKSERLGELSGFRPVGIVLLSIVVFALSIRNLGLAPAVFATTVVACYAETGRNLLLVLLFAALSSIFCVLVFIWGLGLIIPVFVLPWTS